MSVSQNIREQLLKSFRAEINDHVQVLNEGLLALERNQRPGEAHETTLGDIFRAAHSLKGAARAVGASSIEQLAHKLENALDALRQGEIEPSPNFYNTCYKSVDAIQVVHEVYEAGETTPPVEALQAIIALENLQPGQDGGQESAPELPAQTDAESHETLLSNPGGDKGVNPTIRVDVEKVEGLMTHLSELLVAKTRSEERLVSARELQELMVLWQREWYSVRSAFNRALNQDISGAMRRLGPVEKRNGDSGDDRVMGKDILRLLDYLENSQTRLSEATVRINEIVREYDGDTTHMSQVIDELGEEIKRVNMLPLSTITGTFGRMVRDVSQEAGKEAVLQIVGASTEIDKQVLEQIKDPLIHLLRNAIDHGIELPEERSAQGKPRQGTVILEAKQMGKDLVIRVADDGAGLDLEGIQQAVRRQSKEESGAYNREELEEAIFRMGVSSSRMITDISGRGIGLDVVRRNVEALHGRVDVKWEPGEGSSFTLTLPLRLTNSRGLLVQILDQTFVIPVNSIERIITISPIEIISLEGRDAIHYDDRPITVVDLGEVLKLRSVEGMDEAARPAIVLKVAERCIAFAVDEILGEQEVVIKGLGKQLVRVNCIAGCSIMGNGNVVLILNVNDLVNRAARIGHRSRASAAEKDADPQEQVQRRILVVDDSITTRMLEKNILESAGYAVEVAVNGQQALEVIDTWGVPDLMVVDVIMPLMNGFELTEKVKQDSKLSRIPIILVTSLDSPEDKAHGIEVGADAYIIKSNFKQNFLLETIEQLI